MRQIRSPYKDLILAYDRSYKCQYKGSGSSHFVFCFSVRYCQHKYVSKSQHNQLITRRYWMVRQRNGWGLW